MLIDDENPALLQLERLILGDGRLSVGGKFTRVSLGLEYVAANPVDVVFLDIEMPGTNGLEAGEQLLAIRPDIQIVFVTAYHHYAIEAFELNALDYLLKPVEPTRFAKTVSRIESRLRMNRNVPEQPAPAASMIVCFKRLSIEDGSAAGGLLKWRTQKAQELFTFLLHEQGQWVAKDVILETLWPQLQVDKATTQLHTSVYQVRKMLKQWGIQAFIEYSHDSYRLMRNGYLTDVDLFMRGSLMAEVTTQQEWEQLEQKLNLYQGDYLEEHDYFWAKPVREELRRRYIQGSLAAAAYELKAGREHQALQRLLSIKTKEPYSDEICRSVMKAYVALGNTPAAVQYYRDFASLISNELDTNPESQTTRMYQELLEK
ncbi:BTAD domain-containing putative transcriptional regulator [Paenibacillus dendrobii]|uniref:BTAD domain-containing putative transcriptional regulator n=1 Tax=Paenibacillus dendrobii TaxID=2691084 RepID=UPI00311AB474